MDALCRHNRIFSAAPLNIFGCAIKVIAGSADIIVRVEPGAKAPKHPVLLEIAWMQSNNTQM
jgi:hypothetical protein